VRKCAYCDFNSIPYDRPLAQKYLAALAKEMAALPRGFRPETAFIGGGTPTCLSAEELERLLDSLRRNVDLSTVVEFSAEANPGTLDDAKVRILRSAGVGRLSIGAQSFDDGLLKTLGRIHASKEIFSAVETARRGGIDNISLDLIFAIPGQTSDMWREDLRKCCEIAPKHVSTYCLTYERRTPLYLRAERGEIAPLGEDAEADMYQIAMEYLPQRGYRHYEVSNFAIPGFECRHNLLYWQNRTTYGIGAGAYSYVDGSRSANCASVEKYIEMMDVEGAAVVSRETLSPEDRARETAFLMLRTRDGIDKAAFQHETGFDTSAFINEDLKRLIEEGFLKDEGGRLFLSDKGFPVADSILVHFMR
jgi:oxygen-independent coproporphyrinogen-3 oxidase